MKSDLSVSQREVLKELANGNEIYIDWDSGRCMYERTEKSVGKSTVESLLDAELATTFPGFWYRHDKAYKLCIITQAGREMLYKTLPKVSFSRHTYR